ncbi:MAG: type III pantothenate kinase [Planctomycetes bacterium]|nr:type III pantothenate kinase [Planctomycetota bacterium]
MANKPFLAIDLGNTNADAAVFSNDTIIERGKIPVTNIGDLPKAFPSALRKSISRAYVASVNPPAVKRLSAVLIKSFGIKPVIIGREIKVPIEVKIDNPAQAGVDRLLNGLAGFARSGRATVVIDFGTALTFDVINKKGAFIGGIILPGVSMSARTLYDKCALLPMTVTRPVKSVIGKNTAHAINSGIYEGYLGMIRHLIAKITDELGVAPYVIATGGEGGLYVDRLDIDEYDPDLTLKGILLTIKG